jgi:PPOX class probable F420-dependent enzyme
LVRSLPRGVSGRRAAIEGEILRVVERDAVRARVEAASVARLATTDPDGRPHLVPIVFALAGETLYTAVDSKPKRSRHLKRIENARERPAVTVLVDEYQDDWSRLWWVRLRGRARVLESGAEAERALELLREKYAQYRRVPPGLPVLAVDVEEWRDWEADPGSQPAGRRAP